MDVRTLKVDPDTLATRKEIRTSVSKFETPKKGFLSGKLRGPETVTPLARGVAEIYTTTSAVALTNSRNGSSVLRDRLGRQSKSSEDDEFVVPFIQYDDTTSLSFENAAEVARLEANYGDIIPVPLMTPLVDAADDGDDRSTAHVSTIIENTRVFLDAVEELRIQKPVMGVVPIIGEDCTLALLDLYRERGLDAYCVDFNRRSPMAQFQVDEIVGPLMGQLTAYDDRDDHLIYAVNTKNSRRGTGDYRTPDRMYSYAAGFDIVGDNHISPNWPEEVFEKIARQNEGSETTLRLFDGENMAVVEVPVTGLDSFLPANAELSVRRIQERIGKNPDERFRFRNLINAELISIYLESEGGVDPEKIFDALQSGSFTLDRDLQRIEGLAVGVSPDN